MAVQVRPSPEYPVAHAQVAPFASLLHMAFGSHVRSPHVIGGGVSMGASDAIRAPCSNLHPVNASARTRARRTCPSYQGAVPLSDYFVAVNFVSCSRIFLVSPDTSPFSKPART